MAKTVCFKRLILRAADVEELFLPVQLELVQWGEAQEVANGIDRMISEGTPVGQSKLFSRPKHSSAQSDTAFGS
jgi:hypothetical protein